MFSVYEDSHTFNTKIMIQGMIILRLYMLSSFMWALKSS